MEEVKCSLENKTEILSEDYSDDYIEVKYTEEKQLENVNDIITLEEVKRWMFGNIVTLRAPCGRGKSYFVKNLLYLIARQKNEKILFLLHRINCIDQFQYEVERDEKYDVIDIRSYQLLETSKVLDLNKYNYIVCDESHYFMSDACFNHRTDLSYDKIIKSKAIKIFMSATLIRFKEFLKNHVEEGIKIWDYNIEPDFKYINNFYKYKDLQLEDILNNLKPTEKAIVFVYSAKEAYDLYKKYKHNALFNCSKSNKDGLYKYVNKEKIKEMLESERFNTQLLITTTAFEAGINIKDSDVKQIILKDILDINILIQCIGRKRLDNGEQIDIYINNIDNRSIAQRRKKAYSKINQIEYLEDNGREEYLKKYGYTSGGKLEIFDSITGENLYISNELKKYKAQTDITIYNRMLELGKGTNDGYLQYLSHVFKKEIQIINQKERLKDLYEYLNSLIGVKMYKCNKDQLIEKISSLFDSKSIKQPEKLTQELLKFNLPFKIISKRTNTQRFWVVIKT